MDAEKITERLKDVRTELGLTQKRLADELGISRSTIANYENGREEISNKFIKKLHKRFLIDPDWFATGEGSMFSVKGTEIMGGPLSISEPSGGEFKIHEMLQKTTAILESNTIFRAALLSNINAFHQAISADKAIEILQRHVSDLEERTRAQLEELTERLKQVEHEKENLSRVLAGKGLNNRKK